MVYILPRLENVIYFLYNLILNKKKHPHLHSRARAFNGPLLIHPYSTNSRQRLDKCIILTNYCPTLNIIYGTFLSAVATTSPIRRSIVSICAAADNFEILSSRFRHKSCVHVSHMINIGAYRRYIRASSRHRRLGINYDVPTNAIRLIGARQSRMTQSHSGRPC